MDCCKFNNSLLINYDFRMDLDSYGKKISVSCAGMS